MTKTQEKAQSRKRVTQVLRALRSPDQVFPVPSSRPGKPGYFVTVGTDGKVVCSCTRWNNKRPNDHRHCRHQDDVMLENGFHTEVEGDFLYVRR